ncbi:MAG: class I SAM-dependent methyltransferase [Cyanobacteria bacterium P01_H01_bin.35]
MENQANLSKFNEESLLDSYLNNGFHKVEGWCNYKIFDFIKYMSDFQQSYQIKGGVCEIGIHHGKFFIGLHNLTKEGELSLAIDIFDAQKLNVDKSGKGNLAKFKTNLAHFASRQSSIKIMERDSLTLSIKDILDIESELEKFRFFSVDGGHTPEHTVNDFKIAEELVCNGGLVIVDDYFNPNWHGVCEGIARLFLLDSPRIAPFMMGANKLIFTTFSFHNEYFKMALDWVKKREKDSFKHIVMYGYDVVSWIPRK